MARKTPTQIALDALKQIERHEKECGKRWKEATAEMKSLSSQLRNHAARWEKLAWLVSGTVALAFIGFILRSVL